MTCEEALERISAALDGELGAHERRELDAHLNQCPACAALFDELAGCSRVLRELECEIPEDLSARILARLPRWRTGPRFWRRAGAAAACLALALCLGAALWGAASWSARAGQADDPELESIEPYSFDGMAKSAGRSAPAASGVQYLSGVGTGALSGCCVDSASELEALLSAYDRGHLAQMLGYDGEYFAHAALLAVSCRGSAEGERPIVDEVLTMAGGYRVVLRQAAEDGKGADAWLILIEDVDIPTGGGEPFVDIVIEN